MLPAIRARAFTRANGGPGLPGAMPDAEAVGSASEQERVTCVSDFEPHTTSNPITKVVSRSKNIEVEAALPTSALLRVAEERNGYLAGWLSSRWVGSLVTAAQNQQLLNMQSARACDDRGGGGSSEMLKDRDGLGCWRDELERLLACPRFREFFFSDLTREEKTIAQRQLLVIESLLNDGNHAALREVKASLRHQGVLDTRDAMKAAIREHADSSSYSEQKK